MDAVTASVSAGELVLAAHPIITAVPFFVPTFIVAGVVGFVIWRDRSRSAEEQADDPAKAPTVREDPDDPPAEESGH